MYLDQRVGQPLFHIQRAPFIRFARRFFGSTLSSISISQQFLGSFRIFVPQKVLAELQKLLVNVIVNRQTSRIHNPWNQTKLVLSLSLEPVSKKSCHPDVISWTDFYLNVQTNAFIRNHDHQDSFLTHIHASFDGMIEKNRVHGLSNLLFASKWEREIGHAPTDSTSWASLFDSFGGTNEVSTVVVMLGHARGNGQDIRIEDDIIGVETDSFRENLERSLTNGHFRVFVGSLCKKIQNVQVFWGKNSRRFHAFQRASVWFYI